MPKRKRKKTTKNTHEAFLEAFRNGRKLTDAECVKHYEFCANAAITTVEHEEEFTATKQKGRWVFRKGDNPWHPGQEEHPRTIAMSKVERDIATEEAKKKRRAPVEAASAARTAKSQASEIERLLLLYGPTKPGTIKRIAGELGVTKTYVRQIRAKAKLTEGQTSE
jgi:hypothetical protein